MSEPAEEPAAASECRPTCNVELVSREWKAQAAVRLSLVEGDRLFTSPKGKGEGIKICIKDCIHNKYALIPVLGRMAQHPSHPVPYVKPLCQENHGSHKANCFFFGGGA